MKYKRLITRFEREELSVGRMKGISAISATILLALIMLHASLPAQAQVSRRRAPLSAASSRMAAPRVAQQPTFAKSAKQLGGDMPDFHGYVNIDINPNCLSADIYATPGEYPIDDLLRISIDSSDPGWYVEIMATELLLEGDDPQDKINPDEVVLVVADNCHVALDKPYRIYTRGEAGITPLESVLYLNTTDFHTPGVYNGWIIVAVRAQHVSLEKIIRKVPFTVTVRGTVENSITGNKLYFHYGRPNEPQCASVMGNLYSDIPLTLFLSTGSSRMDRMPCVKRPGDSSALDIYIPMMWRLRESGAVALREPDEVLGEHGSYGWLLNGLPGEIDYEIECTVNPSEHQSAGDYGIEVVITLAPTL
jgi:hypothetical protein